MVNCSLLLIFIVLIYHGSTQLDSETLPKVFEFRDFRWPCWISRPRVGISFCKRTLEISSPQPFVPYNHTFYCQSLILPIAVLRENGIIMDFNCTCQIILELEAVFIEEARPHLGVFSTGPWAQWGPQQVAASSLCCMGITGLGKPKSRQS